MKTTITNIDGVKWGFETEMADPPPLPYPASPHQTGFFCVGNGIFEPKTILVYER